MTLVFYDLETTGLDTDNDRIVEMCFVREGAVFHTYVDPGVPIPAEASGVHGVLDATVEGAGGFVDHAEHVQELIDGAVLVSYNGLTFDSLMLDSELVRAGQPGLEKDDGVITHPEIDLFQVWRTCEPRNLTTAVKRFVGRDLERAHSADADTLALVDLMRGMQLTWTDAHTVPDMLERTVDPQAVDREGKFKRDEDGTIVFTFGKNEGKDVRRHADYLGWMLEADFSSQTKAWCRRFLGGWDG